MSHNTKNCTPAQRCKNWRICDHCAKIRQKKAADKAEELEKYAGQLFLTVITPEENTGTALRRARAAMLRKSIAGTGIWSIEKGEKHSRLHINIITPQPKIIEITGAQIHTEQIRTSARSTAAYITKPSAAPSLIQYDGRLLGSWGIIGELMLKREANPIIQAATINDLLKTENIRQPFHYSYCQEANPVFHPELTKQEYKQIAERHLAELYAALHNQNHQQNNGRHLNDNRPRFG